MSNNRFVATWGSKQPRSMFRQHKIHLYQPPVTHNERVIKHVIKQILDIPLDGEIPNMKIIESSPLTVNLSLNTPDKLALYLYFQYLDFIHDHSISNIKLVNWVAFVQLVEESNHFDINLLGKAMAYVLHLCTLLIINKSTQELPGKNSVFTILLYDMLKTTFNKGKNKVYVVRGKLINMKPSTSKKERDILVNLMVLVSSRMNKKAREIDALSLPLGINAYNKSGPSLHGFENYDKILEKNAYVSIDQSSNCSLKRITAKYTKYMHLVNMGDAGIVFNKDTDIIRLLKRIVLKPPKDTLQIKKNMNDYVTKSKYTNNTNMHQNNHEHVIFDKTSLNIHIGTSLVVNVFNNSSERFNQKDTPVVKLKSLLKPSLTFVTKNKQNYQKHIYEFSSKTIGSDKSYVDFCLKFFGDFFNALNCVAQDINFASGDKMACVGYIIAFFLYHDIDYLSTSNSVVKRPLMRLMWEDNTNDIVMLFESSPSDIRTYHFLKHKTSAHNSKIISYAHNQSTIPNSYTSLLSNNEQLKFENLKKPF